MKFYDIFNIVVYVVVVVVDLGVWMVNVYVFGGVCMMIVVCEVLVLFGKDVLFLIVVIVLISMEVSDLVDFGMILLFVDYVECLVVLM